MLCHKSTTVIKNIIAVQLPPHVFFHPVSTSHKPLNACYMPCSNILSGLAFLHLFFSLTVGLLILLPLFSDVHKKLNQNKYLVNITVTH